MEFAFLVEAPEIEEACAPVRNLTSFRIEAWNLRGRLRRVEATHSQRSFYFFLFCTSASIFSTALF